MAFVVWLGAESAGVPTLVDVPSLGPTALQWTNFVSVGVVTGLGAALVALLADGRRNARRLFTTIALVMLVLSMAPLVVQPDTVALSARIVLALTQVVLYLTVVPRLADRLRAR